MEVDRVPVAEATCLMAVFWSSGVVNDDDDNEDGDVSRIDAMAWFSLYIW